MKNKFDWDAFDFGITIGVSMTLVFLALVLHFKW